MDDSVGAVEQALQVGHPDVGLDELVAAGGGQVVQRGVALGRQVVDHHDLGARAGISQLADQARADVTERASDHYSHANVSMVRSRPSGKVQ